MTKSAIVTYGRQNFFPVPVPPPAWTPHCASKVEVLEPPPSRNVVADQWTEVQADRQAGGSEWRPYLNLQHLIARTIDAADTGVAGPDTT